MADKDQIYIQALQTNDQRGIKAIYQEFLPRVARFIERNGGSKDDAKDIFQEALLIIYQKSKSADFQLSSQFYTLLYGISRNLWGNQLQKKSRTEVTLSEDIKYNSIPDLSQWIDKAEEEKLFWDAFHQLGEDCQRILQLFFTKVKMEAIVQQLGLSSVSFAKKKKFQCKEQLVKLVKADARYQELSQ
jgi:RNA polymerase sigma factor (sigma-70 family)